MILVIDDHADTCAVLTKLLAVSGYTSRCFTDPLDAMEHLVELEPQCVILDDNMPDLTGLEVLDVIRGNERFVGLPVILYSSGEDSDRQAEAKTLGAAAWIVKGTAFSVLLDQVAGLVSNRRLGTATNFTRRRAERRYDPHA